MHTVQRIILAAACTGALAPAMAAPDRAPHRADRLRYRITVLPSLGGTSSRANSIDDLGVVGGYSKPEGDHVRHASVWAFGRPFDLGSLGGPGFNSTIAWPVKNDVLLVSGISETGATNPLGETWSCGFFFATRGNVCYGFVRSLFGGPMQPLHPLPGGYNSYAAGTNDAGRTVGWAENGVRDPTCARDSDQVLQFKPVYWNWGSAAAHELPLLAGDSSGAATAINDRGQIVGISGDCDQAVGRATARHAVLWENGRITDLGNLGADLWNTPGAINADGDVVGFAGTDPADVAGTFTHAFLKKRGQPMQDLGVLPGDVGSTGTGINRRGQVVGYSSDASNHPRAFLWQDGTMIELASLAPDFAGTLDLANDIDDFGRIVGRATDRATGAPVAFVATPVAH